MMTILAGWLDPALRPERVRAMASGLRPVAAMASGGVVYELPRPSAPTGPLPAQP